MTYEYQCKEQSCQHQWEEQQKITEPPITKCPKCGQESAQRLVSGGTATIFRGAGWFGTGGY